MLREKEQGDWSRLTKEEVQELYRATFCRSFAEMQAPTGEWKLALGGTLVACSVAIWIYLWMKVFGESTAGYSGAGVPLAERFSVNREGVGGSAWSMVIVTLGWSGFRVFLKINFIYRLI